MRAVVAVLALAVSTAGCAELGVVTDGSSISYGRPSRGRLIDGQKLPESGPGYVTPATWKTRGNRYGTNELISLIKGVSKRMRKRVKDVRLAVADLSGNNGGEERRFHRSHQSGRDVDLMYYVRDADGKPLEPDVMHVFDGTLKARDGSGITLDVQRTWMLVRELLTAQEAYVQYIFMYRPIAEKLIEHATTMKEPDVLLARAAKALKQPGDSAPHNDHMHVRVYCAHNDRMFGCQDIGPLELLAEREAEAQKTVEAIAAALPPADDDHIDHVPPVAPASPPADPAAVAVADPEVPREKTAADVWIAAGSSGPPQPSPLPSPSLSSPSLSSQASVAQSTSVAPPSASFNALVRASSHRIDLRSWR